MNDFICTSRCYIVLTCTSMDWGNKVVINTECGSDDILLVIHNS